VFSLFRCAAAGGGHGAADSAGAAGTTPVGVSGAGPSPIRRIGHRGGAPKPPWRAAARAGPHPGADRPGGPAPGRSGLAHKLL